MFFSFNKNASLIVNSPDALNSKLPDVLHARYLSQSTLSLRIAEMHIKITVSKIASSSSGVARFTIRLIASYRPRLMQT